MKKHIKILILGFFTGLLLGNSGMGMAAFFVTTLLGLVAMNFALKEMDKETIYQEQSENEQKTTTNSF